MCAGGGGEGNCYGSAVYNGHRMRVTDFRVSYRSTCTNKGVSGLSL